MYVAAACTVEQRGQFGDGKRAPHAQHPVVAAHWVEAKRERREPESDLGESCPLQVGHDHADARHTHGFPQELARGVVVEVVEQEGADRHVHRAVMQRKRQGVRADRHALTSGGDAGEAFVHVESDAVGLESGTGCHTPYDVSRTSKAGAEVEDSHRLGGVANQRVDANGEGAVAAQPAVAACDIAVRALPKRPRRAGIVQDLGALLPRGDDPAQRTCT